MDRSECLAGMMLAARKRLLKNSVSDSNYVGTFCAPKRIVKVDENILMRRNPKMGIQGC